LRALGPATVNKYRIIAIGEGNGDALTDLRHHRRKTRVVGVIKICGRNGRRDGGVVNDVALRDNGVGDLAVGACPLRHCVCVGRVGHAGKKLVDANNFYSALSPAGAPEDGLDGDRLKDLTSVIAKLAWGVKPFDRTGSAVLSKGLTGVRDPQSRMCGWLRETGAVALQSATGAQANAWIQVLLQRLPTICGTCLGVHHPAGKRCGKQARCGQQL
jgi:hypothetical protein